MSMLSIQLPDSLYKSFQILAAQGGVSLDQFIALAVAERISALTPERYLQERASRGDRKTRRTTKKGELMPAPIFRFMNA
ncbi:MAG: toxin-antitoxin system HicB family antitoxin [Synechococcales cyanobacterium K44_A2020_017]|nr:toxin-antitoxin system HicB family antitoxin [Synechococcales cyanobacterium K32_A2020_035]MBF2093410.1 toxin-antitoxin system HicB family antitoxin [Synechococcales cyanobacterium K44_A2020_017]